MKMNGNTNQKKNSGNFNNFNAHEKSLRRRKIDNEQEAEDDNVEKLVESVPEGTTKNPKFLKSLLDSVPNRLKNCVVRTIFAIAMISGFCLLIYGGPFTLMLLVYLIQVKCFQEIITIGYKVYNIQELPLFRWLSWYFLIASNYFLYGENLFDYLGVFFSRIEILRFMISYHRFLSFCIYGLGVVLFIVSLVKKYSMKQFILMGWTHTTLLIFVVVSYQVFQNIFEGLIWFVVPISMIIMNDIMAYIFGFFFGKTPLIQLSPKKTWEGFIGGGLATVVFGVILSYFLCQYQHFICPVEYSETAANFVMECEPSYIFQLQDYTIDISSLGISKTISMYPFVFHSLSMSIFSSVIGPFGGFFASGFKRAFKIKDFGDLIPGHGGITDRFDCQVLMGVFVNVYIYSFIRTPSPQKILAQITKLQPEQQLEFYYELKEHLESSF